MIALKTDLDALTPVPPLPYSDLVPTPGYVQCQLASDCGDTGSLAVYIDHERAEPRVSEPFAILEHLNRSRGFNHAANDAPRCAGAHRPGGR